MSADFDINSHLMNMRFGQQSSSGSSGGGGGADTMDSLVSKGVDQTVQNVVRIAGSALGVNVNSDIEGKSALSGFDPQSVGGGLSLSNAAPIRAESGGGWLSMVWDKMRQYFTRDLPAGTGGGDGGGGGSGFGDGGGTGGGGGGDAFGDGSGSAMMSGGGGGDVQGPAGVGSAPDMPDVQVSYGGKMMSADAMVADLGNLRPAATPVNGRTEVDFGNVSMG